MAAVEEGVLAAERARTVERRGQRRRRLWIASAAGSYGLDVVFLGLFAAAGAVPGWLPVAFLAGVAVLNGAVYAATAGEWNLRLRDPSMVLPQSVCGVALQMAVVFVAPRIAFPWLANLITVLAFATLWLSPGASVALWAWCAGLAAVLFHGSSGRLGLALGSAAQVALSWLFFSVILGRLVFLSAYSASMRNRLHESRRKLAVSIEQVRALASHDELTRALNRRSIMARLEEERASAVRTGQPLCVALLDLDDFKAVNDTHGHGAGDAVLRAFADTVRATMRDIDILGRYGGEEFLLILTDTTLGGARLARERLCRAVAASDCARIAPGLSIGVSIGVAAWRSGEETGQALARADAALYRAKANGKGRVEAA